MAILPLNQESGVNLETKTKQTNEPDPYACSYLMLCLPSEILGQTIKEDLGKNRESFEGCTDFAFLS